MYTLANKQDMIYKTLKNKSGLTFNFLDNGSVYSTFYQDIMVNQLLANAFDGSVGNIYIRIHGDKEINYYPVIGPKSTSGYSLSERGAVWKGEVHGIDYVCRLALSEEATWFYTVSISNRRASETTVDIVFAQDIGIAHEGAVRTNELYTSQYIDHQSYLTYQWGYVVCSRQNQKQNNKTPWLMLGCLDRAAGFLTDGYQFYGLSYKETGIPIALTAESLPNEKYQYEFALPAVQSEKYQLEPEECKAITFFVSVDDDHREVTSEEDVQRVEGINKLFREVDAKLNSDVAPKKEDWIKPENYMGSEVRLYQASALSDVELITYFGERIHEEFSNEQLMSFFTKSAGHVVLKAKERLTERTHGHIMRSGMDVAPNEEMMAVTAWMNGIFCSHISIGNTNFNKMMTPSRNGLNVVKASGQRILLRREKGYELLGMPSAFEMEYNSARWIYKGAEETITVRVWTDTETTACYTDIHVEGSKALEFVVTNNIMAGNMEEERSPDVEVLRDEGIVLIKPDQDELISKYYPGALFAISVGESSEIKACGGPELLINKEEDRPLPYIIYQTEAVRDFSLKMSGSVLHGDSVQDQVFRVKERKLSYEDARIRHRDFFQQLSNYSRFNDAEGHSTGFNEVIQWYSHNAMIHFTSPHGLEQYSGAAWGLRDVCQGPVEFLLATKSYDVLREVILKVYSYQLQQTGDWRQWFMIDRYREIQDANSHNDIIIWPIKALADYIEATGDYSILDEDVGYIDEKTYEVTGVKATVYEHTLKQYDKIVNDCIDETALISYGHGDWEDTLQPAQSAMRKQLVSTWTVELVYENLMRYSEIIEQHGHVEMSQKMKEFCKTSYQDFKTYLMKDGVVAGLVHVGKTIDYLLHPSDQQTGVAYRLIPMTRGIISEMFEPVEALEHMKLIKEKMLYADGVRLMDRPLQYRGGQETFFKRAETGANFGREIGLQYVHAHIRYLQALAKLGDGKALYQGLMAINQINIKKTVKTAHPRQSNCFFSSSDAAFSDRYQAYAGYDAIGDETVGIKGGWRIYSSGPGIFLGRLILDFMGVKDYLGDVYLDPVLPLELNGISYDTQYKGKQVSYHYVIENNEYTPYKIEINGREVGFMTRDKNPYRTDGVIISRQIFEEAMDRENNKVVIYL